ncbi:MAG: hypothetical protein ACU84J_12175 [Gammaproteobacteria bacterium]
MHALVDIAKTRGPDTISREDVQRKPVVMANVAGRDLSGVVNDIRCKVAAVIGVYAAGRVQAEGSMIGFIILFEIATRSGVMPMLRETRKIICRRRQYRVKGHLPVNIRFTI